MSRPPTVIQFAYNGYEVREGSKQIAKCKFCVKQNILCEKVGTTSNFTRHLRQSHPDQYQLYKDSKNMTTDESQPTITEYISGNRTSARQVVPGSRLATQINQSIVYDLIVCESLPVRIVETPGFKKFLQIVAPGHKPLCRGSVKKQLHVKAQEVKSSITKKLECSTSVSATVDIWSDRKMRSFLGVTAHVLNPDKISLDSYTLACDRFRGRHTGENIAAAFEKILVEFRIKDKLDYVITDNAANMKKAFSVHFDFAQGDNDCGSEDSLENATMWETPDDHEQIIGEISETVKQGRLACFAHTLQLCIKDGLERGTPIRPALSKLSALSNLLHSSTIFKEAFELKFGERKSIATSNKTRWNSMLFEVQSICALDHTQLSELCESVGHPEMIFSAREWSQLKELINILDPFAIATDLTQGEYTPTISCVVPTLLSLYNHANRHILTVNYLRALVEALKNSLLKRFAGVFENVNMITTDESLDRPIGNPEPFGETIYLTSCVLDPKFAFHWLMDLNCSEQSRIALRQKIIELITTEADTHSYNMTSQATKSSSDEEVLDPPQSKYSRLFKYTSKQSKQSSIRGNAMTQMVKYLEETDKLMCRFESDDSLHFWATRKNEYPMLFSVVQKCLSIPASSAPVERVFSRGGFILRPCRSNISEDLLSTLVFLKCNSSLI